MELILKGSFVTKKQNKKLNKMENFKSFLKECYRNISERYCGKVLFIKWNLKTIFAKLKNVLKRKIDGNDPKIYIFSYNYNNNNKTPTKK